MLPPWIIDKMAREETERDALDKRLPLYRPPPPPPSSRPPTTLPSLDSESMSISRALAASRFLFL